MSVPVTERIYVAPPEAPALPELPPVVQRKLITIQMIVFAYRLKKS